MSNPVSIKLQDLASSARANKLSDIVGRDSQLSRLTRSLMQPSHHHVALIGEPGAGKSSLIEALALRLARGQYQPLEPKVYRLATAAIAGLLASGENMRPCTGALAQAASRLESGILVVEDVQLLASDDPNRLELTLNLLEALIATPHIRLIITMTTTAFHRHFRDNYIFARTFQTLVLETATIEEAIPMTEPAVVRLEQLHHLAISDQATRTAAQLGHRFGHGRALPDAAIRLLEAACGVVSLESGQTVKPHHIEAIVSENENLPSRDLTPDRAARAAQLEPDLLASVVGQKFPLRTIARTVAKAQLGLTDASKPRGSFLLLGPSGVGKTETAKALTRLVFANPRALVRLDMSEYGESHAAIRLIGSPPGYVGYEEGGQLTGAVAQQPYSLILLDEIEKAHPKVFDLFLQMLDDGRLTDSAGQTVNFTDTLVMATSNTAATDIAAAAAHGIDVQSAAFMKDTIMPQLMSTYRPEFINRFDAVLIYEPLTVEHMVDIAQRELQILAGRLTPYGISFAVANETIAALLAPVANPMFGARPVKRLIATRFETPLANLLLRGALTGPVEITGLEPWLVREVMA